MKILIIVESKHLGNTKKIADAMAKAAPVDITDVAGAADYRLDDYDIIGFGSGIYMGRHDKRLLKFADGLCDKPADCFVFSTSGGSDFEQNNRALVDLLTAKNKTVLGVFSCRALDKFFVLWLTGGVNKGHPDADDLKNAQDFICDIIAKQQAKVAAQ